MDGTIPGLADNTVPLHLRPGDWEDLLDALGAAAERTSAAIDCDTCTTTAPCTHHDPQWARVDRWRALASQLRNRLNTT
jgi:cellobiose phosphorylase